MTPTKNEINDGVQPLIGQESDVHPNSIVTALTSVQPFHLYHSEEIRYSNTIPMRFNASRSSRTTKIKRTREVVHELTDASDFPRTAAKVTTAPRSSPT